MNKRAACLDLRLTHTHCVIDYRYGKLDKAGRTISDDVRVGVLPRFRRRSTGQLRYVRSAEAAEMHGNCC